MNTGTIISPWVRRLLSCLAGGFILALMWGPQEGSRTDYGYGFRQAVLHPRIFVFLAIGLLGFAAITYWSRISPWLRRPGARSLGAGAAVVAASYTLLHWYDPIGDAKFSSVAQAVARTPSMPQPASAFFGWLAWTQFAAVLVLGGVAVVRADRRLGWAAALASAGAGVLSCVAHQQVVSFDVGVDHSLGASGALLGYLVMALGCCAACVTRQGHATARITLARIMEWRPGLPPALLGTIVGVLALAQATWFSPDRLDATLSDTHALFEGSGLASVALLYLGGVGWLVFGTSVILVGTGSYFRRRVLSACGMLAGLGGLLLTLVTLYDISDIGAQRGVDGATGPWQNLGSGGWLACLAFSVVAAGGYIAATAPSPGSSTVRSRRIGFASLRLAPGRSRGAATGASAKSLLLMGLALALFYPPTLTDFWQTVLVSQIGVYVLLAAGLNVVIGWAGLLDLGFIAFYAIGSYTTAYLVGSLPVQPPSWLHMSPLLAIPFAIVICLVAGIALGTPTLRLRGDYLAIVTLGFGEIIRIVAINNPGNFTNSTRGPAKPVPHPEIHLGPLHLTWGSNNLQYWYLLLVLILVVVGLFYRLENSRIGRAWEAIREDEVAARTHGINATRVKLLAFAIGASTSGVAGVFFASQVGYFNPDNFVLNNSVLVVAYVVFGGMGSLPGAIAGAAALTWLPEFLKDQVPADDRQMWIGAVLLAMMIFRPAGLIPARRRKADLPDHDGGPEIPGPREAAAESRATVEAAGPDSREPVGATTDREVVFDVGRLTLRFGGVVSLKNVSFQMFRGEVLAVIGPNGAGKTSLFNSLTGIYTPQEGSILLSGRAGSRPVSVLGKEMHVLNHLGVARTFQNIRLFPDLTALENVKIGVETRFRSGPIAAMLRMPWQRREERQSTERAYSLLAEVGLEKHANSTASSLSYADQRRLEIARALGTDPGVLLLDEPAAGTNPAEKRELADLITRINCEYGVSVLLIEHDMKLVMSVAHRIVVLDFGQKIAEGSPQEVQKHPAVIAAYLGTAEGEDDEESSREAIGLSVGMQQSSIGQGDSDDRD
ncbi:branched-chain amino acid ABC transporter ATP-binding protein/permease [Streptomyces sp. NPDC006668]|uniref:branched-chain amino acid ABC transporter ATP-binding protein/permease n=1 Tax=Streptomyces sp. NPDC006668 TaxID=3156903 RepID=UPI0033FE99E7